MCKYKEYSNIIKNITGLVGTEVIINENSLPLAYAGWTGYEDYIVPNDIDLTYEAMVDFYDFLEPEHIKYYHIGLGGEISKLVKNETEQIVKEMICNTGVKYNTESLEAFIILHEFGHVDRLLNHLKGNINVYIKEQYRESCARYDLKHGNYSDKEVAVKYRQLDSEKYADNFAKMHLSKVVNKISECKEEIGK